MTKWHGSLPVINGAQQTLDISLPPPPHKEKVTVVAIRSRGRDSCITDNVAVGAPQWADADLYNTVSPSRHAPTFCRSKPNSLRGS